VRRREFLQSTAFMGASFFLKNEPFYLNHWRHNGNSLNDQEKEAKTREVFSRIIQKALKEDWASLPIGECMGKIATLFVGTDYVGGTLEGKGPEICRVDLTGLDCVTFFENVLCLARILKKGKTSFEDLLAELTFTRYRKGILTDYTSRLHYTSDWIQDNEEKRVVKNVTKELGGEDYTVRVSFMSENPGYYQALREFPEFIGTIAGIEQEINKRKHWYIPQSKIRSVHKRLQTGDIIAVATEKEGLDYSHTGLTFRDEKDKIRFLHASSAKKEVFLDMQLHKYIKSVKTHTGITVARPLEVNEI